MITVINETQHEENGMNVTEAFESEYDSFIDGGGDLWIKDFYHECFIGVWDGHFCIVLPEEFEDYDESGACLSPKDITCVFE